MSQVRITPPVLPRPAAQYDVQNEELFRAELERVLREIIARLRQIA